MSYKATIWYMRPIFLAPDSVVVAIRIAPGQKVPAAFYATHVYTHPSPTPDPFDLIGALLLFTAVAALVVYLRRNLRQHDSRLLAAPSNTSLGQLAAPAHPHVPLLEAPIPPMPQARPAPARVRRPVRAKKKRQQTPTLVIRQTDG